jgi:hypothetical protein
MDKSTVYTKTKYAYANNKFNLKLYFSITIVLIYSNKGVFYF